MIDSLLLVVFGSFALALPSRVDSSIHRRADCPNENKPWIITNITSFTSSKNKQTSSTQNPTSSISFDFNDLNPGIELNTSCSRQTNTTSVVDPTNYYLCDDINVEFKWLGDSLQIARRFKNEW